MICSGGGAHGVGCLYAFEESYRHAQSRTRSRASTSESSIINARRGVPTRDLIRRYMTDARSLTTQGHRD